MRRTAAVRRLGCFLSLCLVFGCSHPSGDEASFVATVIESNPAVLLVEPTEGSVELNSADRMAVHLGNAVITDAQGHEVEPGVLNAGSRVIIMYDGKIAESYPAQIWGLQIQLLE